MAKRTLLIDGDIVVYQQACAHQRDIQWDEETTSRTIDEEEAKAKASEVIHGLIETLEATDAFVCLSDAKSNWRKAILPTYKANRQDKERPVLLPSLRSYLMKTFKVAMLPTLEADDVMGILSTKPGDGERIIVSVDKDMRSVPGLLYNPNKPEKGVLSVSKEEADYRHLYQTLTGDPTDNYFGAPGIGPKRAEKVLKTTIADGGDLWPAVVKAYEAKQMTEEDALLNARVARICRAEDYDWKKKEVILWVP